MCVFVKRSVNLFYDIFMKKKKITLIEITFFSLNIASNYIPLEDFPDLYWNVVIELFTEVQFH